MKKLRVGFHSYQMFGPRWTIFEYVHMFIFVCIRAYIHTDFTSPYISLKKMPVVSKS